MANATMKYVLTKNQLPSAKEPYNGLFVSNGTTDIDAFAEAICAERTNIDAPTMKLILRTAFKFIGEDMAENVFRYNTGDLVFEPAISGSVESMDAALGPDNEIYVAVRLAQDVIRTIGQIVPTRDSDDAVGVRLDSILDVAPNTIGQIGDTGAFQLTGKNLSAVGDGESIVVTDSAGTEHTALVEDTDGKGQRLTAHLVDSPAPGKATLVLTSRGYNTPDGELVTLRKNVTIAEGPGPRIVSVLGEGLKPGELNISATITVTGKNLAGAAAQFCYTDPVGSTIINELVLTNVTDTSFKFCLGGGPTYATDVHDAKLVVTTPLGSAKFPVVYV